MGGLKNASPFSMDKKRSGLQVSTPHTTKFFGAWVDSLVGSDLPAPYHWRRQPKMAIADARNYLVQYFLENPAKPDYLLFVDNDATWHRDAIRRMLEHDLPIVCATMYTRALPPMPTQAWYIGNKPDGSPVYKFDHAIYTVRQVARKYKLDEDTPNELCLPIDKDSLKEVDATGFHFTMVRRDVVEKIKPPWFVMDYNRGVGEDFYFCKKAKDNGFPVYWDTGIHTGHLIGEDSEVGIRELLSYSHYVDEDYGKEP